jgi:DNA-binding response OmpR family regulator
MGPFVLIVGDSLHNLGNAARLAASGSIVVLAPNAAAVRAWLDGLGGTEEERLRRSEISRLGDLVIDRGGHWAKWRGAPLPLSEQEFQILAALAEEPGRAWSFQELLARVWGAPSGGHPAQVRAAVRRLRSKLDRLSVKLEIEAARGVGFRLEA